MQLNNYNLNFLIHISVLKSPYRLAKQKQPRNKRLEVHYVFSKNRNISLETKKRFTYFFSCIAMEAGGKVLIDNAVLQRNAEIYDGYDTSASRTF